MFPDRTSSTGGSPTSRVVSFLCLVWSRSPLGPAYTPTVTRPQSSSTVPDSSPPSGPDKILLRGRSGGVHSRREPSIDLTSVSGGTGDVSTPRSVGTTHLPWRQVSGPTTQRPSTRDGRPETDHVVVTVTSKPPLTDPPFASSVHRGRDVNDPQDIQTGGFCRNGSGPGLHTRIWFYQLTVSFPLQAQ